MSILNRRDKALRDVVGSEAVEILQAVGAINPFAKSWKAVVGSERASNGLRFASEEEAERYLWELTGRWLGAPRPHAVTQSPDPVTHTADRHGKTSPLELEEEGT